MTRARRVTKRQSPRHGQGTPDQLAWWADHWQKARASLYRRKNPPRTYEKPNPPPSTWMAREGSKGETNE